MRMSFRAPQIAQETIVKCDRCKGPTRVRDTVSKPESVLRRRLCKSCGHSFSTVEQVREATQKSQPTIFGTANSVEPRRRREPVMDADTDEWSGIDLDDIELIIREELGGFDNGR